MINYHNRTFRSQSNSASGEVTESTVFHYQQKGNVITATYDGGNIILGQIIGIVDKKGVIDMRYQHLNTSKIMMTGQCRSHPTILPNGKVQLHEKWKWTCADFSEGESVIIEV